MPQSLAVKDLAVSYGTVVAVRGLSVVVAPGTVSVLLGSNGAGKTSTLNAISGLAPRIRGEVMLGERRLDGLPAHRIAREGVLHVPEGRRVVSPLTVEENLTLGAYAARGRSDSRFERAFAELDTIYELFSNLHARRRVKAGLLSGGEQQMLALGRALMGAPEVLLLDEPSMGLSPKLVDAVLEWVSRIAAAGIGVLMVEQNVAALDIASYGYVLRDGELVLEARAEDLVTNPAVVQAYLGAEESTSASDSTQK